MPASKLFLNLATGSNPTLFDHSGGEDRSFSEESLALALVTYQNFSPLVGRGFTGRGPCVDRNALHVLRIGGDLADSVLANCLSRESCPMKFGRPIWEEEAEENATRTYLGRLAPRTRAIWISDERNAFVMDNGFLYPVHPAWREPTFAEKLIRKKDADEPLLIPASLARGVWRELDALLAERPEERSAPPLTLRRRYPGGGGLRTGGMVTDYKAKVEDLAESVFIGDRAIPGVMFADPVVRSWYRGGIASAETWSWAVSKAVAAFSTALKLDENSRAGIRDVAQRHYWNSAERGLPQLFALVVALDAEPELLKREDRAFTPDEPDAPSSWHSALRAAARDAYRTACPQDTSRQILAYVQGEKALYLTSRKSTAKTRKTLRPV